MTEDKSGRYSCTASLPHERRSIVRTVVRVRPEIILSRGLALTASEGEDVLMDCNLVPGVDAKRMWQFNGTFNFDYGARRSSKNQGSLMILHRARPSDSGNYTCIAIKAGQQDVIEYSVKINRKLSAEKCDHVQDMPASISGLYRLDNDTVGVTWVLPEDVNISCFDHVALVWWTNSSEGRFQELKLGLEAKIAELPDVEDSLTYYVQVNLVAPFNVLVYGRTRKFVIGDLSIGLPPDQLDSLFGSSSGVHKYYNLFFLL